MSVKCDGYVVQRFWQQVDKKSDDECWPWTGHKDRGYGRLFYNYRALKAHRVSYELHYGPITKEQCVCHACDNPSCVNPKHLWLGSKTDNTLDCVKKARHCKKESHGMAKLKIADVKEIIRHVNSGERRVDIARLFGVAPSTINRIASKNGWQGLGELIEIDQRQVRQQLIESGLSGYQASKLTGVNRSTIHKFMKGASIQPFNLTRLSKILPEKEAKE